MGIKFKDKTSVGAPVATEVAEREIVFDLKDNSIYSSTDGTDIVKLGGGSEQGGILHITIDQDYAVGDIVTLVGSNFQYVCKTAHTSTVACDTAPDDANWYQPGIPAVTYNFTSDLLGTVSPVVPVGPHAVTPPDENGPYYFSVDLGSVSKSAVVLLEGFELSSADYDLTLDGYIKILSPVADNSWLKILV